MSIENYKKILNESTLSEDDVIDADKMLGESILEDFSIDALVQTITEAEIIYDHLKQRELPFDDLLKMEFSRFKIHKGDQYNSSKCVSEDRIIKLYRLEKTKVQPSKQYIIISLFGDHFSQYVSRRITFIARIAKSLEKARKNAQKRDQTTNMTILMHIKYNHFCKAVRIFIDRKKLRANK